MEDGQIEKSHESQLVLQKSQERDQAGTLPPLRLYQRHESSVPQKHAQSPQIRPFNQEGEKFDSANLDP